MRGSAGNAATALAIDQIRGVSSVPVIGVIEPGAQRAKSASRDRKVVVIGTDATVSSHAYQRALSALGVESREKACPLLVPLVEEGWVGHTVTEQVARIYLGEAFGDGFSSADVLLLGCTHYPLLKPILQRVVPENVTLVDSAESTALAVWSLVNSGTADVNRLNNVARKPDKKAIPSKDMRFFVTDSTEKFRRLGCKFLGQEIPDITHVDLKE